MNPVIVRNVKIGEGVPKICVPIVGVTKEEIINEAKTFENIPVDVVEWRVDWFEHVFEFEKVEEVLKRAERSFGRDTIVIHIPYFKRGRRESNRGKRICRIK